MINYKRWFFIALLKAEIDGCNLNESSTSFQIFTALYIGERSLPRCCFEKWNFEDLVGLCDEIRLSWVLTVKTTVILLKNIFEFMFNRARST